MTSTRMLTLFLMAICFTSLNVAGQQITGSIRGTVLDPSGAIVQAARVTAKKIETGLTRSAVTDRQGEYVLVELPIGHYQLEVQAKGFQRYLQQGISLDVNQVATVGIHLRLGSETQQVEVSANAALVQSTVSSLGQTVMEHEILDLPLDGRNFSQLGLLQPGVVPLTPGLLQATTSARWTADLFSSRRSTRLPSSKFSAITRMRSSDATLAPRPISSRDRGPTHSMVPPGNFSATTRWIHPITSRKTCNR